VTPTAIKVLKVVKKSKEPITCAQVAKELQVSAPKASAILSHAFHCRKITRVRLDKPGQHNPRFAYMRRGMRASVVTRSTNGQDLESRVKRVEGALAAIVSALADG
jgi:hypothetical protein